MAISAGTINKLLNYLNITWNDPELVAVITDIASRGEVYINKYGKATYEFDEPGLHQSLLFDYVRYERSFSLNEFQKDYLQELASLMLEGRA